MNYNFLAKNSYLILLYPLIIVSCTDPISSTQDITTPPDISLQELIAAPEIVEVENKNIILRTEIYLNLMPIVSETPMIIPIYLETADSSDFPQSINAKSVYVIYNGKIWKSFFMDDDSAGMDPYPFRLFKVARNGPNWGPDIYVDVVVALETENRFFLIIAKDQYVEAVY